VISAITGTKISSSVTNRMTDGWSSGGSATIEVRQVLLHRRQELSKGVTTVLRTPVPKDQFPPLVAQDLR